MDQYWSWILGIIGLLGFYLAGRKVWWCWYVNIFNQVLWFVYSVVTEQWGFLIATFGYLFVFVKNAIAWTKEHRDPFVNFDFNEYTHLQEELRDKEPALDSFDVDTPLLLETKTHRFDVDLLQYYTSDDVAEKVHQETQWWLNYIGKAANTPVVLYREETMIPGRARFTIELRDNRRPK